MDASQPGDGQTLLIVSQVYVPDTASVYIDERYVGRARVLAVKPKVLKPGVKYITFEADDHFPHDVRIDLPPGETTLDIKLRPVPP